MQTQEDIWINKIETQKVNRDELPFDSKLVFDIGDVSNNIELKFSNIFEKFKFKKFTENHERSHYFWDDSSCIKNNLEYKILNNKWELCEWDNTVFQFDIKKQIPDNLCDFNKAWLENKPRFANINEHWESQHINLGLFNYGSGKTNLLSRLLYYLDTDKQKNIANPDIFDFLNFWGYSENSYSVELIVDKNRKTVQYVIKIIKIYKFKKLSKGFNYYITLILDSDRINLPPPYHFFMNAIFISLSRKKKWLKLKLLKIIKIKMKLFYQNLFLRLLSIFINKMMTLMTMRIYSLRYQNIYTI